MVETAPAKQRIFIVEDESIVAADLAQILTGLGYEVTGSAVSGVQAIAAINADPPDLVLMDIVLQGPMDGIETATHIRARHDVPIVYLTAYSDSEIISRAQTAEPYGYLIKPLTERELHATIELALAKSRVENRLRASEARFREMADFLPQPIFEADCGGKITFANRRALEQFQLTGEDVARGTNLLDFTVPEEQEAARARYRERLAGAPPAGRVWRLRRKDGSVFPAEINTSPILDNLRPIGLRGFVLDLTERLKAEGVLRASEERYRTLAETAHDIIFIVDRGGTILYVNRFGAEQFGVTPEQLIGLRPADLFPAEVSQVQHADIEKVFASGKPFHLENQAVFPQGGLRWLDTHLLPLRGPQGEIASVLGISRDVTDRRRSEEASRTAARQWQSTFDAVSDAICLLDAEGRIERCNRGMLAIFGLAEERVVGQYCWKIMHRTERPIPDCPFVRARATRQRETIELEQDGRWSEVTVDPFFDEQGAVTGAVHIIRDITARREAEKKIQAMNGELVAANRELQSLDAMKSNLLSTVSHELRTPLVSIRGYIEMISEGKSGQVSDKQREQFGITIRNIDRLGALIDSLLDYSRLELGQLRLRRTTFDLRALVRETVEVILPRAHARGLALELEPGGEPVPVHADHERIIQVCLNLIDNAIKFTESGGRITLRVEALAGRWGRVTVSDTGIGIPAAEQEKVFRRFYQVDNTSTRRRGGMGIGLALCRELLKLHDGEITVSSREGAGATFIFTIPLADGPGAGRAPESGT